jgi:hypothetical protein
MSAFEKGLKRLVENLKYCIGVTNALLPKSDDCLTASELILLTRVSMASGHPSAAAIWDLCRCCSSST